MEFGADSTRDLQECAPPEACIAAPTPPPPVLEIQLRAVFGMAQSAPADGVEAALAAVKASYGANCAAGYGESRCATCTDGYYRKHGVCSVCPARGYTLIVIYCIAIVLLGVVIQFLYANRQKLKGVSARRRPC